MLMMEESFLFSPPTPPRPQTPERLFFKLDPTPIYKCQTNPREPPPLTLAPARRERRRRRAVWTAPKAVQGTHGGLDQLGFTLVVP